jgi:hypothetical protein
MIADYAKFFELTQYLKVSLGSELLRKLLYLKSCGCYWPCNNRCYFFNCSIAFGLLSYFYALTVSANYIKIDMLTNV